MSSAKTGRYLGIVLGACALFMGSLLRTAKADELVSYESGAGAFRLVADGSAAPLYVDPDDDAVVQHATALLAGDIERVTGQKPTVQNAAEDIAGQPVLIGTIGHSRLIDRLIADGKLEVDGVRGEWESYTLQTVDHPFDGVDQALVLAGSDRRGTAYAVFELSEQIGVSPWYWWADVAPDHHDALFVNSGAHKQGPPSVKYRGIFINDEDWGLEPWSRLTFDTPNEDIGPKVYAKVFELILRLRGNYLWPAMHHDTDEFAAVPGNVELADEWAIVMGSAHSEPMLRNNVWWHRDGKGDWRFDTNRKNVLAYWEEWAKKRGKYENVWTVGMRGIHDSGMQGPQSVEEQATLLGQVIRAQRGLLKQYVNPDVKDVPQIFTPYKEALAQYQAGLDLPDDVTIVWAEDNFGYIRQLSTPKEQKRAGGSGIYYHISYLGWPRPYLWVNTTPPALIWEEMHKAYDYGADRVWVLNVGDIKPGEVGIEFWQRMAWDVDRYGPDAQPTFLREWAERDFGSAFAEETAEIMGEFYRLGLGRKPELMEGDLFSLVHYGEAERRLEDYQSLLARAESLYEQMPARKRDGFYELVLYPVRIAAWTNEAFITADFSRLYALQGRVSANDFADRSTAAVERIKAENAYYNNELADGKWRHMAMTKGITGNWNVQWAPTGHVEPTAEPHLGVVVENRGVPMLPAALIQADDTSIDLAAGEGQYEKPMELRRDGDVEYLVVPNTEPANSGNTLEAGAGAKATYKFNVSHDGHYNLFLLVNVPTNKDDSWFLKLDDGKWQAWNDIGSRQPWDWRQQGSYDLKAGPHTLTIANREDGAMFSRIRFTTRDVPQRLDEFYADSGPVDRLPTFNEFTRERHFIDLFDTGDAPLEWSASASEPWIKLDREHGRLDGQDRLWVDVDWANAPKGEDLAGTITLDGAGDEHTVRLQAHNPESPSADTVAGFVENDGYVSIEAEHFTRHTEHDGAAWKVIDGLGRTGDAVSVFPTTMPSRTDVNEIESAAPAMEYDMTMFTAGDVQITAYCLPTHRIHEGRGLRYAIAMDDESPQIVDFEESGGAGGEQSAAWRDNVSRNAAISVSTHHVTEPGKHTLHVWAVDPGVVIDKFVIDAGGLKKSYLGPPETAAASED